MPYQVTCPECRTPFEIGTELLGEAVLCPTCRRSLRVGSASPLPSSAEAPAQITPRWTSVISGLNLIYWATLGLLVIAIATQGSAVLTATDRSLGPLLEVVSTWGMWASILPYLLGFVGVCLSCSAPDRSARQRAVATVQLVAGVVLTCLFVAFVIAVRRFVVGPGGGGSFDLPALFGLIAMLGICGVSCGVMISTVLIAAFVSLVLFHARVADLCERPALRNEAIAYLCISLLVLAGYVTDVFLTGRRSDTDVDAIRIHGGGLLVSVILFGWYLRICGSTIRALAAGRRHA